MDCSTFPSLNVSACTLLQVLRINNQDISADHLTACSNLSSIFIDTNHFHTFSYLRFDGWQHLKYLHISGSHVVDLFFIGCQAVTTLELLDNPFMDRCEMSDCAALKTITVVRCGLRHLSISGCSALTSVQCINSPLKALHLHDTASCASLRELRLEKTSMDILDVSPAGLVLESLHCIGDDSLRAVCISGCKVLSTLDLSECLSLMELRCGGCSCLNFASSRFCMAGSLFHLTEQMMHTAGGLTPNKAVSVYIHRRHMSFGNSTYWPERNVAEVEESATSGEETDEDGEEDTN